MTGGDRGQAPAGDGSDARSWRERRRDAAAAQASAFERRKAAETERARRIVEDFVAEARTRGIPTEPLVARSYSGHGPYRTPLKGWYVRRNRSLAVGEDGEFYILTVPGGVLARLRGADVAPSDPPLVVGAGGRDGEAMALEDLLRQRLDTDWA